MAKSAQEKADLKAEKIYEKKHRKKYRARPGDIFFNMINYLVFTLFTVACIFPFYYLFINTISDNDLVVKGVINFIPRGLHLDNYKSLLNVSDLSNAFLVSLGRTIIGTAFMVAASAFVGYLVTKQEMWGRKFWYRFTIITMYFNAGLIPWYMTIKSVHLLGTIWALVLPGAVPVFSVVLMLNFFRAIPEELEEAAFMDGANHWNILARIYIPLSKASIATICLFALVYHWNSWFDGIILMNKPTQYPLQSYLQTIIIQGDTSVNSTTDWQTMALVSDRTVKCAQIFLSTLPIVAAYPFLQRYFVKGMVMGSVKG